MGDSEGDAILAATIRTATEACEGLSPEDALFAIEMAWLATASNLRSAQLAVPGAFPAEQERQARVLEKMTDVVRSDRPDLELERLWQEGDYEAAARHIIGLLKEADDGA